MRKPTSAEKILGVSLLSAGLIIGRLATNDGNLFSSPEPFDTHAGAAPAATAKPNTPATACPDRGDPMPDPTAVEKYCFPPTSASSTPAHSAAPEASSANCPPIDLTKGVKLQGKGLDGSVRAENGPDCVDVFSMTTSTRLGSIAAGSEFSIICYDMSNQTMVLRNAANPPFTGRSLYEMGGLGQMSQEGGYLFARCGDVDLGVFMSMPPSSPTTTPVPTPS